jgi:hypothetical protein
MKCPNRIRHSVLGALATMMVGSLAVSTAAAKGSKLAYPVQLQGIWYNDDAEGKAQCRDYRKSNKNDDDDEVSRYLVGAMVISGSMMHDYSEYGEGNFYGLRRLEKTGRDSWRVGVAYGIDTVPEESQTEDDTLIVKLARGKLTVRTLPHMLNLKDSWQLNYKLARCADLPEGFDRGKFEQ